MAGKVQNVLNLEIVAGKAQPAPPLWPMLWANWVNIGQFTKEFNDKTQDFMQKFAGFDVKIKCKLTIYADRTFKVDIWYPVTSNLILWKIKQKKGSWVPNKEKIEWKLTRADMEEIYEIKKWDLNAADLEWAIKIISGTAKNMWVEVEK